MLLLGAGVEKDARDEDGNTALHYATELGYKPIVEMLIEHKARTDIRNCSGVLPRDLASPEIAKIMPQHEEIEEE